MTPKLKCNFIGADEPILLAQARELAKLGITIELNANDKNHCWYTAGGEEIKRVEFQDAYVTLDGYQGQCSKGRFLFFNRGRPKRPVERFEEFKTNGALPDDLDIIEFMVVAENESDCIGQGDDLAKVERAIVDHIASSWADAKIIDYQGILAGKVNDHQMYSVQIAGYHLPKPENKRSDGQGLPDLNTATCPEWVLHREKIEGVTQALEGWELVKTGEGQGTSKYTAVPRKELRSQDLYLEDLRTELGLKFLVGDDPIRLLTGMNYIDDSSVVGLSCPQIEVEIAEIPKRGDNCLAWIERDSEPAVREKLGRRLSEFGDGYIISYGNGTYKYISPTGSLDKTKARTAIDKRTPEQVGFEKEITDRHVVKDDVCSAVEFRVKYTEIPVSQPSFLPIKDKKMSEMSKELRREAVEAVASPRRVEEFADKVIRAAIEQAKSSGGIDGRTVDVVIAVDTSGSMDPAAELVKRSARQI